MKDTATVFDYDGTLIDTVGVKIESYARAVIEEFGADPAKRPVITETQLRLGGAPKYLQLAETLRALGLAASEKQIESWNRRYVSYNEHHTPQCLEFPAVRKMLAELGARYDLYLTSGLPDADLKADAARRDLAKFFVEIRGGDKAGFLRELRERGYRDVVFVGDGKYDEIAAREAGVRFILIGSNEDLKGLAARLGG
jgi:phosphoglycolate phosphatase-like HAD superfamily hydrolase